VHSRLIESSPPSPHVNNDAVCGDCVADFWEDAGSNCWACSDCDDENRDEDAACTANSDAVCGDCADGFWEDAGGEGEGGESGEAGECMAWTECEDGWHEAEAGTPTSDRVCEEDEGEGSDSDSADGSDSVSAASATAASVLAALAAAVAVTKAQA